MVEQAEEGAEDGREETTFVVVNEDYDKELAGPHSWG